MAAISNKIVILVMSVLATAWSLRDDDRNDQQKQHKVRMSLSHTITKSRILHWRQECRDVSIFVTPDMQGYTYTIVSMANLRLPCL